MARLASGGRHGLAQSLFQVGGNVGSALGPLLAAFIVVPWGQGSLAWFSVARRGGDGAPVPRRPLVSGAPGASARRAAHGRRRRCAGRRVGRAFAIGILLCLIFSKYFYLASLTSYYTFYLIHKFGVSVQDAQLHLFVFLGAVAVGHVRRRPGRRPVRLQGGDLGVDPRRAAVHPRAALCRTCSGRPFSPSRSA